MQARDGRIRIQVLHPEDLLSSTIGGVATFLRDFVRLAPDDLDIEVIGATSDTAERPVGRWQAWDVGTRTVRFLPLVRAPHPDRLSRFPVSLRFTMALARRRVGADPHRTLQFHRPEVSLAFRRHRGPRVQLVHIDIQDGPQATRWRRIPVIYRLVEDMTIPRMDRVFMANQAGVSLYRSRFPKRSERIQFLSGWYDDSVFFPGTARERRALRDELASRLGGPAVSHERWVLYVARLELEKDPLLAVDAFAALGPSPSTGERLLVAGEGSLRGAMEERARALGVLGRVEFLGAVSRREVADWMRASEALLLTSRTEGGGPRVLMEALGSGLPVVSTLVGGVAEMVSDDRVGRVVRDRTPKPLAEALRVVTDLPRDVVVPAALEAARPFAAERVLQSLYDAHRAIADRRGR
jgi:glycosyltransferase involved in cell wall biosynthesis